MTVAHGLPDVGSSTGEPRGCAGQNQKCRVLQDFGRTRPRKARIQTCVLLRFRKPMSKPESEFGPAMGNTPIDPHPLESYARGTLKVCSSFRSRPLRLKARWQSTHPVGQHICLVSKANQGDDGPCAPPVCPIFSCSPRLRRGVPQTDPFWRATPIRQCRSGIAYPGH